MKVPYNPFEPFDEWFLNELITMGKHYVIIQNFNWPGINKGLMVTPYKEISLARKHAEKLTPKEGVPINLLLDAKKVTQLINHSQYNIFLNNLSDEEWASLVLQNYKDKVVAYLKSNTSIPPDSKVSIGLNFEYGRLKAVIESDGYRAEIDAYDLIK